MQLVCQVLKHHYNFSDCELAHEVLSSLADLEQLYHISLACILSIYSKHYVLVVHESLKRQATIREFLTQILLALIRPLPQLRELTVLVCYGTANNSVSPRHHLALCLHAYAGRLPLCGQLFTAHHFMHIPLGFGG